MSSLLQRWPAADPGRRFDDLFNLAYDPATVAFARVAVPGVRISLGSTA